MYSQLFEYLKTQVAQLSSIEPAAVKVMGREAAHLDEDWTCEYGEYQSGGWKTLSLYNQTGNPRDTVIEDGPGMETRLLKKMPETQKFLRHLGLEIMSVRIARLEPKAFLWEHRDYAELNDRQRLRLHVPLITNPSCHLIIGGQAVHMTAGHIWMLNPTERHGVCNLGHQSRYHLLLDIYTCVNSAKLVANATLDHQSVITLPVPSAAEVQNALVNAINLAKLGYSTSAEMALLKRFHRFHLSEGESYNLIIQMYDQLNNSSESKKWQSRRDKYLGQDVYGTLYA